MRKISKSTYLPQTRPNVPMVEGNAFMKSSYNPGITILIKAPVAPKRKVEGYDLGKTAKSNFL